MFDDQTLTIINLGRHTPLLNLPSFNWRRFMNGQSRITLIQERYKNIGGNPDQITIILKDGGENDALSYNVIKDDNQNSRVTIFRHDIDDENFLNIDQKLSQLL